MLYIFSGPHRKGDVGSLLQSLGQVDNLLQFDLHRSSEHDLSKESLWQHIFQLLGEGDWILIASPPCETFSRVRHRHPGPRPLRSAFYPRGFPWLSNAHLQQVEQANYFVDQTVTACQLAWQYFLEHPEDLGATPDREFSASIWQFPALRELQVTTKALTFALFQCTFEAPTSKPTRILTNLAAFTLEPPAHATWPRFDSEGRYVGPLPPRCPQGKHAPLAGREGRKWATASSAAYPSLMCEWIAHAVLSSASQGGATSASRSMEVPQVSHEVPQVLSQPQVSQEVPRPLAQAGLGRIEAVLQVSQEVPQGPVQPQVSPVQPQVSQVQEVPQDPMQPQVSQVSPVQPQVSQVQVSPVQPQVSQVSQEVPQDPVQPQVSQVSQEVPQDPVQPQQVSQVSPSQPQVSQVSQEVPQDPSQVVVGRVEAVGLEAVCPRAPSAKKPTNAEDFARFSPSSRTPTRAEVHALFDLLPHENPPRASMASTWVPSSFSTGLYRKGGSRWSQVRLCKVPSFYRGTDDIRAQQHAGSSFHHHWPLPQYGHQAS